MAKSGRFTERQFAENDRVSVADLVNRTVTSGYKQGDTCVFLDAQTFEELDLTSEQVGEQPQPARDSPSRSSRIAPMNPVGRRCRAAGPSGNSALPGLWVGRTSKFGRASGP